MIIFFCGSTDSIATTDSGEINSTNHEKNLAIASQANNDWSELKNLIDNTPLETELSKSINELQKKADTCLNSENYQEALLIYKEILTKIPELEDHLKYQLAERYYQQKKYSEAALEGQNVLEKFPHSVYFSDFLRIAGLSAYEMGNWSKAIADLEQLKSLKNTNMASGATAWSDELAWKLASSYEKSGDLLKAAEQYWALWLEYPASRYVTESLIAKAEIISYIFAQKLPSSKLSILIQRVKNLEEEGHFEQALDEYKKILSLAKEKNDIAKIKIEIGKNLLNLRSYQEAQQYLKDVLYSDNATSSATALDEVSLKAEARYFLTKIAIRNNLSKDWIEYTKTILEEKRKTTDKKFKLLSEYDTKVLLYAGQYFQDLDDIDLSFQALECVCENSTQPFYINMARWYLGWIYYYCGSTAGNIGDYENAYQEFNSIEIQFLDQNMIPKVLYWQAKAAQKCAKEEEFRNLMEALVLNFSETYYGSLAQTNLKELSVLEDPQKRKLEKDNNSSRKPFNKTLCLAYSDQVTDYLSLEESTQIHYQRAKSFYTHALFKECALECEEILKKEELFLPAYLLAAFAYYNSSRYFQAVVTIRQVLPTLHSEKNEDLWQIWKSKLYKIIYPYPYAYRSIIEKEANSVALQPYLVAGLILQESAFDARAKSGPGARGLMQIMPNLAKELCRKHKISNYQLESLYDPDLNIKLGIHHLKVLYKQFNGRLPFALAAYNAGVRNAKKWITNFNADYKLLKAEDAITPQATAEDNDDLFIESIPFSETREYIKAVLRNQLQYQSLYYEN